MARIIVSAALLAAAVGAEDAIDTERSCVSINGVLRGVSRLASVDTRARR